MSIQENVIQMGKLNPDICPVPESTEYRHVHDRQRAVTSGTVSTRVSMQYHHVTESNRNLNAILSSSTYPLARRCAARILTSSSFDLCIGIVIVINSAFIGWEQTLRAQQRPTRLQDYFEHAFLVVYIFELALRFFALGVRALQDNWVKFDLLLVMTSIVTQWVIEPLLGAESAKGASPLLVMRTARLARLARALRLLVKFRQLWMLVRGLLASAKMVVYTLILLFIILYMFAAVGMEVITLDESYQGPHMIESAAYRNIVSQYFADLPMTLLTLIQFISADDTSQIYRPMVEARVELVFYFMGLILIVGVVIMNIVIAVLVNGALEQADQDKSVLKLERDRRKRQTLVVLREMFDRLDETGCGQISRDKLLSASQDDKALLHDFMELKDPLEVFNSLDIDDSGCVDIQEFIDGLYDTAVCRNPIQWRRMDKKFDVLQRQQDESKELLFELHANIMQLSSSVKSITTHTQNAISAQSAKVIHGGHQWRQKVSAEEALRIVLDDEPCQPAATRASCQQKVSCNDVHVLQDGPIWVAEVAFELRQLRDSFQKLDTDVQKCFSTLKVGTPASIVEFNESYPLSRSSPSVKTFDKVQFTPHLATELPALVPDIIFQKVAASDSVLREKFPNTSCNIEKADFRTQSEDSEKRVLCTPRGLDMSQMSAPCKNDGFGVASLHQSDTKIRMASRKPNGNPTCTQGLLKMHTNS